MSAVQVLRAATSKVAVVRPPARKTSTVRAAFRKPPTKRNLKTQPPQQSVAANPGLLTSDKNRDIITHTIWGEHDFAVFFLFFMILPFLPIMAPGLVWVCRAMTGY